MSMMLMAKNMRNAGTTWDDPPISKKDNLYKEVSGEWDQVMVICNSILALLDLTWDDPGEEVSLEFL